MSLITSATRRITRRPSHRALEAPPVAPTLPYPSISARGRIRIQGAQLIKRAASFRRVGINPVVLVRAGSVTTLIHSTSATRPAQGAPGLGNCFVANFPPSEPNLNGTNEEALRTPSEIERQKEICRPPCALNPRVSRYEARVIPKRRRRDVGRQPLRDEGESPQVGFDIGEGIVDHPFARHS